ncbi:MAG: tetraacyldisaccharide 4'-kinase [Polyangiaceae bacterium]
MKVSLRTLATTRGAALIEKGWRTGALRVPGALLGRIYERLYLVHASRPLALPDGVRAVAVGGPTFGGSYKTPLAIASAIALSNMGARVVFVGHGHGAKPGPARIVKVHDDVRTVGDEALLAMQALSPFGIPVVVSEERGTALALAATLGEVLVVDGTVHVASSREGAVFRVLASSSSEPWGSGLVFPLGDLRASPHAFRERGDYLGYVAMHDAREAEDDVRGTLDLAAHASLELPPLLDGTARYASDPPRIRRIGVLTAIARPGRFLRALATRGIEPVVTLRAPDHRGNAVSAEARLLAERHGLDAWLTTSKCALSLGETWLGAPRHTARLSLTLTPTFSARLRCLIDGP